MSQESNEALKFDEHGLVPAVIQDWQDATVLMLGYMNQEAIAKTVETKSVHFWSRSRKRLWEKVKPRATGCRSKKCFSIVTVTRF